MIKFNCDPVSTSLLAEPLVFSWDPEAGTVDGPDADLVREMAGWSQISAHPLPWAWNLSDDPLRSYTDMAAIVGLHHVLPPELADHYPRYEPPADGPDDGIPTPDVQA